jgi:hypothetical protein
MELDHHRVRIQVAQIDTRLDSVLSQPSRAERFTPPLTRKDRGCSHLVAANKADPIL